jgi:hypothetical protein
VREEAISLSGRASSSRDHTAERTQAYRLSNTVGARHRAGDYDSSARRCQVVIMTSVGMGAPRPGSGSPAMMSTATPTCRAARELGAALSFANPDRGAVAPCSPSSASDHLRNDQTTDDGL